MISKECKITVSGNTASIDSEIYLYKNDMNIKYLFNIVNGDYAYTKDSNLDNIINANKASYAQIKFKKEDIEIDFDVQETSNGKVILLIKKELIDEDTELGDYTIQIRLFDESKTSVITLPPVNNCIHIMRPIFEKVDGSTNVVDEAAVDEAIVTYSEPMEAIASDGTFAKKTWVAKEKITTAELNRIEEGIAYNNSQYKDIANLKNTGLTLTQIDLLKDVLYKMEFSTEELATQGKQAIDKLISSLKNTQSGGKVLSSISAVYNGGNVLVGTDINSLDIIVTGNYSDGSTVNITNFTVSGKIENGENTITVSYNDKTTTITVIGYVEGKNDIKGDVVFSDNYISKNKDYSFYQLTSEVGRRAYSIPITANKKYTLTWDLDNQYRNPNIGSIDYSTGILNKDNAIWLICTTSDMKNSTTERTTGTFESPTILTNLYTQQKGDDNNYYTSAEITWANDGYFSIDDSEIVPVHIYEG